MTRENKREQTEQLRFLLRIDKLELKYKDGRGSSFSESNLFRDILKRAMK